MFSTELYRRHGLDAAGLLAGVRMARAEGDEAPEAPAGGGSNDDDAKAGARARAAAATPSGSPRTALETASDRVENPDRRSPSRHARSRRCGLRQLELWRAKGTDLLRERRSLTPLRKAWIAARMR